MFDEQAPMTVPGDGRSGSRTLDPTFYLVGLVCGQVGPLVLRDDVNREWFYWKRQILSSVVYIYSYIIYYIYFFK